MSDTESALSQAILRFVSKHGGSPRAWLVALSGGPDSVALLHVLTLLRENQGWQIQAGHVNHRLRGEESDADEAFVRELCLSFQVPLHVERLDVRTVSQTEGQNLEATARKMRYEWLHTLARKLHLPWLATGHQSDDQAETILHHLLRGTGLRGLRGIASFRKLCDQVSLVRPLLDVDRQSIISYLQSFDLANRHDRTNEDMNFMRNRLRHELLPVLVDRYSTHVKRHLLSLAEQASEWQDYLSNQAQHLLLQVEKPRVGKLLLLDQRTLAAAPPLLVRELFHLLWEREAWPRGEMTASHWQRIAAVAAGEQRGCELPGGLQVRHRGHVLQVGPE